MTRRWTSASSRCGSTSASTLTRSLSRRSSSRSERRFLCIRPQVNHSVARSQSYRAPGLGLTFARRAPDFALAFGLDRGRLLEAQAYLLLGELGGVGDAGVERFGVR